MRILSPQTRRGLAALACLMALSAGVSAQVNAQVAPQVESHDERVVSEDPVAEGTAVAQAAEPRGLSEAMAQANAAYNAGRYPEAAQHFIEAIQLAPERAEPYKNLARTYFWQSDYSAAAAYYDFYLRLAPQADDLEQIRSERRLASNRAGGQAWVMPEGQTMALRALNAQLQDGRAYTPGGGGAWGLYRTLMRMQYAQPDLESLRERLARRLIDEFEAVMVPHDKQLVASLDLEDWKVQGERLRAARSLQHDELMVDLFARRELIVRAAEALLLGQHAEAAAFSHQAIARNPDMDFVRWFHIVALMRSNQPEKALGAVEELARKLANSAPEQLDYARIMRASVLQSMARSEDAADLYLQVLSR